MLHFIAYQNIPEQIEILFDEQGINDLILYLQNLKICKDHMHLIEGNEIDKYEIEAISKNIISSIKHVRLEYLLGRSVLISK